MSSTCPPAPMPLTPAPMALTLHTYFSCTTTFRDVYVRGCYVLLMWLLNEEEEQVEMWRLNIVEYTNRFVDAETICNKTELKRCVAILWCVQAKSASCLQREEKGVLACLVWTVGVRLQVKSSQVKSSSL